MQGKLRTALSEHEHTHNYSCANFVNFSAKVLQTWATKLLKNYKLTTQSDSKVTAPAWQVRNCYTLFVIFKFFSQPNASNPPYFHSRLQCADIHSHPCTQMRVHAKAVKKSRVQMPAHVLKSDLAATIFFMLGQVCICARALRVNGLV